MADIPIDAIPRRVQFTGNTGLGPFAFTFNILAAADIAVYKNATLLTITTDYTVSLNANGTGSVTLTGAGSGTALVAADYLTIIGDLPLARTTDFTTAGDLLASALNDQLDASVVMTQQISERVDRALRQDPNDVDGDMTIPDKATRLGKYLRFNDTTGNPEAGSIAGAYTAAGMNNYNFTGDGATTAFTLGIEPGSENNTQVYIDGVYQEKGTYSVSGTTLTFSQAPPNLSGIEVMVLEVLPSGSNSAANVTFKQAGSSTQRTVQLKLQESVSVQDFGASPSASASVNTAAIQAAIDSVGAHGHVYIPSGTYDIDGTIIVRNAYTGIHIACDGKMNYVGTTVAWQFGEPGGKLWEPNFKGLYVTRAYTTPFETGLLYTAFSFLSTSEGVFDDLRCQGFRYGYSLVGTQSSVSVNTFNSISSQDCFYNIYMNTSDHDNAYTTANMFVGGYHVTNQVNFDDNVTSGAALIQMENTYRLTRSGNTVDGNRFIGGTYEQPVHRKVYCEGNSNSWSGCYFDTGSKQSGAAWYPTPPAAGAYPFHQSTPVPGFTTAAGSAVLTNVGSGYNAYISVGDRIGIVAATDMSDNGDYVCVAVDANSVTVNHNLATPGTCSIVHDTANIEFTATGTNNTIIDCSDIAYQQITSVDTAKTTRVIGGQMGFTSGVMPNFGFTPSINNPFGFTDAQSKGSLGIVGTTPSGGDEGMQGYLGNINDGDLSSYTLKFVGLDANGRLSAYSAIKANKEGRNTSQAFGGFKFQVRQNTTNADLVDAVEIATDKSLRISGFLAATVNSVTSTGALTFLELNNEIDTTAGAIALTLADGVVGHMLNLIMIADGGDAVITPANFGNGTTLTFNDVGDSCSLMFTSGNWWVLSNNGCVIA